MPTKNYWTSNNIIYWPAVDTNASCVFILSVKNNKMDFLLLTSITSNSCNKIVLCHTNQPCGASGDTVMIGFGERNNTLVYGNLNEAYSKVSTGGCNPFTLDFIIFNEGFWCKIMVIICSVEIDR